MTTTAAANPPEVCDEDYKKENPDAVDDSVEPDADECDETPETGEVQAEQDEDPASEDGPYAEETERQANDEEYGETEAEAQEVIERMAGRLRSAPAGRGLIQEPPRRPSSALSQSRERPPAPKPR